MIHQPILYIFYPLPPAEHEQRSARARVVLVGGHVAQALVVRRPDEHERLVRLAREPAVQLDAAVPKE